jgi:hypothetical protein
VVNTGLHYSATYEQDLQELVHWWRQHRTAAPFLVWKDTPTQHFDQVCDLSGCKEHTLMSPLALTLSLLRGTHHASSVAGLLGHADEDVHQINKVSVNDRY